MDKLKPDPKITGLYAGILSLVEIGLGSLLHSLHIPFSGTFLSLNQSSFLTRVVKLNQKAVGSRTLAYRVSTITAILKSLSPVGKRLLPMLAISAQGCFFSLGTLLLGPTLLGCLLGSALSSTWGILQPLAINALVFSTALGKDKLLAAFNFFNLSWDNLVLILVTAFILKATLSVILSFFFWQIKKDEQFMIHQTLLKWGTKGLSQQSEMNSKGSPWKKALRELFRPLFLIPFAMTALFLFFSESTKTVMVWGLLRIVATGYLFFLAIRLFPVGNLISRWGLGGTALASAIAFLEEQKKND